jgi:TIR domain-containing protein
MATIKLIRLANYDGDFMLEVDGTMYPAEYHSPQGPYYVPARKLLPAQLTDLPYGVRVFLCDSTISSRALVPRTPYCEFEHYRLGHFVANITSSFFPEPHTQGEESVRHALTNVLQHARTRLSRFEAAGILESHRLPHEYINSERADISFTVRLAPQSFTDAEAYVRQLDVSLRYETTWSMLNGHGSEPISPLLFICYASEDIEFVTRLVSELDRRALCAWFDRRELLVGDSIIDRVNQALTEARYLIAVLSPHSIQKPWVARELNSTLMRQLARENNIQILPLLFQSCNLPPLLADIKYADFRMSFEQGLGELLSALANNVPDNAA